MREVEVTISMDNYKKDFIIDVEKYLSDSEVDDIVNEFYRNKVFELTGVTWDYLNLEPVDF